MRPTVFVLVQEAAAKNARLKTLNFMTKLPDAPHQDAVLSVECGEQRFASNFFFGEGAEDSRGIGDQAETRVVAVGRVDPEPWRILAGQGHEARVLRLHLAIVRERSEVVRVDLVRDVVEP